MCVFHRRPARKLSFGKLSMKVGYRYTGVCTQMEDCMYNFTLVAHMPLATPVFQSVFA